MNLGEEKIKKLKLKWPFINVLSEYINNKTKMLFECSECGHKWSTTIDAVIMSSHGCPNCKVKKAFREKAIDHAKKHISDKFIFLGVDDTDSHHIKYILKCKQCGNIRSTNLSNIKRYDCKYCASRNAGQLHKLTTSQFINNAKMVHGNLYDYSKTNYEHNKKKVVITCPIHGDFSISPTKHVYCQQGCPVCAGSGLEKITYEFLKEKGIRFEREYYVNYKNRKMFVDFYIEFNENKYFIELNGEQHYKSIPHWKGEEGFKKQQIRDSLLKEYCDINNITLFVIKFDQIIRNELLQIIKEITAAPNGEKSGKNGEP